ncbi:MAG: DUF6051 family protein, partial [Bacteroidota bacterium]|nr:DUF6051 family protein [Bacteroidota bacterium]
MDYSTQYTYLKKAFSSGEPRNDLGNEEILKFEFNSDSYPILPGVDHYHCVHHSLDIDIDNTFFNDIGSIEEPIHVLDIKVEENRKFEYFILKPKDGKKIKNITFLVHGFNEKNWDKYLPWGQAICERTHNAIIFFPIAFHMQRAPLQWSDKRKMFELSEKRKAKYPEIIHSTLSNAAISMRLHYMPQRFIWSGLQTYYDFIQFLEQCKSGKHEMIDPDFKFNIFAYSIGG